mmetsp:Transcript_28059/g.55133  ORF Transcript_28059/g.55133 Transcript_28059/m.55133 type:complete len:87 (-) Transcript_28059:608-868(-)
MGECYGCGMAGCLGDWPCCMVELCKLSALLVPFPMLDLVSEHGSPYTFWILTAVAYWDNAAALFNECSRRLAPDFTCHPRKTHGRI